MIRLLKSLYHILPFKQSLFSIIRKIWKPGESIYRHLHFKGIFTVDLGNKASFKMQHYGYTLENDIFWAGLSGWEKETISLWTRLCSNANVILDIGANTGIFSLVARVSNPQAKIFAFEPVERVFRKLDHNIKLNNFEIKGIEKALSNVDGSAVIYDTGAEHMYSVTVNANRNSADVNVQAIKITTLRLDTFIEAEKLDAIDLIKMDVETHEPEVLEGFGNYLAAFKPSVIIEILNEEVGKRVENLVRDCGYLYYKIDEKEGPQIQPHIVPHKNGYNYLLCTPATATRLNLG
jgi:FkbM family methyltransferase